MKFIMLITVLLKVLTAHAQVVGQEVVLLNGKTYTIEAYEGDGIVAVKSTDGEHAYGLYKDERDLKPTPEEMVKLLNELAYTIKSEGAMNVSPMIFFEKNSALKAKKHIKEILFDPFFNRYMFEEILWVMKYTTLPGEPVITDFQTSDPAEFPLAIALSVSNASLLPQIKNALNAEKQKFYLATPEVAKNSRFHIILDFKNGICKAQSHVRVAAFEIQRPDRIATRSAEKCVGVVKELVRERPVYFGI